MMKVQLYSLHFRVVAVLEPLWGLEEWAEPNPRFCPFFPAPYLKHSGLSMTTTQECNEYN